MKFMHVITFLYVIIVFVPPVTVLSKCDRSCPGGTLKTVPYPFGFSPGCEIQLNCSSNGTVSLQKFPVQHITSSTILINLPAECSRDISTLGKLYTPNYAPSIFNAILLENCTANVTTCMIPKTMVQAHFELLNCGDKESKNVSCYSDPDKSNSFLNYENVVKIGCRSLFSAIASEWYGNSTGVSLNVQMVQLGWWVEGQCDCANGAVCNTLVSPSDGRAGYRCACAEGLEGDGFRNGEGCRKADSGDCNISKYFSGHCGGKARIGSLVGGIAVGAALIVFIGLLSCYIRRRSISQARIRSNRQLCKATGITIPIYPYEDIEKATESFSDKRRLGTGAYGTVYSGKLHSHEYVAIKRIRYRPDSDSIEQVMNEIKLLSSVDHPNLVRLLGCSIDKSEQILIYEYMPNGTLCQHLQGERGTGLAWLVRLTIATETAQAIAYLHSMSPPIYHRDVKSTNILLDYNYKAKVADFGLSRLGICEISHISTAPQGTPGYLDPEYHQNFHLSDKSDVYSFGVVLVEIITALRAVDFSRRQNEINLASLAVDRIGNGSLDEIIDPFLELNKDKWTSSSIHKVAELAFRCLAFHSDMRPSMAEVANELEQIRLTRWASCAEDMTVSSYEASSCSSLSVVNDKSSNVMTKKTEWSRRGLSGSVNSVTSKLFSPKSEQDPWPSNTSSPSSNSLLPNAV